MVAGVMQREDKWWIMYADEVKAATALLPFTQPGKELAVEFLQPTPALQQLAATVAQTAFGGQLVVRLEHAFNNFIPCDNLVKELHGAK